MKGFKPLIIVTGGLNTDIVASGVGEILAPGELSRGGTLVIGPGGKSGNMARMMARLLGPNRVAMLGRTARDPFGLWRVPMEALSRAGVNTDYIKIGGRGKKREFPGVALIAVSRSGENQIYCIPGINDRFSPGDVDGAERLFASCAALDGILALALEQPLETAVRAARKAGAKKIRVVLDPGGMDRERDYTGLLRSGIHIIKPNEHEASMLTGVKVRDFSSARRAARAFFAMGIRNVMITHGPRGAYVFGDGLEEHIPIPQLPCTGPVDETGCGDQCMAFLCAETVSGEPFAKAARKAILAGTLQFYRQGIQPVTKKELEKAVRNFPRGVKK